MDSFILCLLSSIPRTPISTRSRSTNTRRRELAAIRGRVSWGDMSKSGHQRKSACVSAGSGHSLNNGHAGPAGACLKCANSGLMHRSKQRLYSITSSARVRRQLNSTPSLRTVSAYARSPIIVANACSSASSPRASAGTSVNPSGPAASRVDFRRSRLGAKSSAARRLGAKPRRSVKADIGLAARTARG